MRALRQRATVLGEGGRVEDDQVVLVVVAVEILEGVLAESLMAMVLGRKIERHVGVGELHGLGRAIDGVDLAGSAPHRIDGEAAV